MLLLATAVAVVSYRVDSLLASLQTLSTPPPVVTDKTFMEDDDPDMPQGPIEVDTGPARQALETAPPMDAARRSGDGGLAARMQRAVSSSGDLVGGAAVATGLKEGRGTPMTLLVMGVDAQPGAPIDIGVRPDALMVVRLDPQDRSCRVLSIPRDTRVDLPGYGQSKINHALMVGGIPYQLLVTEEFLDLDIDHYLLIDFIAFQRMVNTVGGVTVDVPEDLTRNGELAFSKGSQHLDGEEALRYARFRSVPEGDLGRVQRHWSLLAGLAEAVQGRDLAGDVNQMLPTLEAHLRTDLNVTDMSQIAKDYGKRCTTTGTESIEMIEGSRVRLQDPILNQSVYYNVVREGTVQERVQALLGEVAPSAPATPVPTTPAPATPSAAGAGRARRSLTSHI